MEGQVGGAFVIDSQAHAQVGNAAPVGHEDERVGGGVVEDALGGVAGDVFGVGAGDRLARYRDAHVEADGRGVGVVEAKIPAAGEERRVVAQSDVEAFARRIGLEEVIEIAEVREVAFFDEHLDRERGFKIRDAGLHVVGVVGDVGGGVNPGAGADAEAPVDEDVGVGGVGVGRFHDQGDVVHVAGVGEGVVGDDEVPRGAGWFADEVAQASGAVGEEHGRCRGFVAEVALAAVVVNHAVGEDRVFPAAPGAVVVEGDGVGAAQAGEDADEVAGFFVVNGVGDVDARDVLFLVARVDDHDDVGSGRLFGQSVANGKGQAARAHDDVVARVVAAEGGIAGEGVEGEVGGLLVFGLHADVEDFVGLRVGEDEHFGAAAPHGAVGGRDGRVAQEEEIGSGGAAPDIQINVGFAVA